MTIPMFPDDPIDDNSRPSDDLKAAQLRAHNHAAMFLTMLRKFEDHTISFEDAIEEYTAATSRTHKLSDIVFRCEEIRHLLAVLEDAIDEAMKSW